MIHMMRGGCLSDSLSMEEELGAHLVGVLCKDVENTGLGHVKEIGGSHTVPEQQRVSALPERNKKMEKSIFMHRQGCD